MNECMMSVNDVRDFLGISKNHVYKLAQEGKIPCYKCGKVWRFKPSELERWLKSKQQGSIDGD